MRWLIPRTRRKYAAACLLGEGTFFYFLRIHLNGLKGEDERGFYAALGKKYRVAFIANVCDKSRGNNNFVTNISFSEEKLSKPFFSPKRETGGCHLFKGPRVVIRE